MLRRIGNDTNSLKLNNTFRKLWEQHGLWTRSFIISAVDELKDLDPVTKRLLRNPTDFANVLKVYYGNEKANEFRVLLEQHLAIAADLVNNAKAGNTEAADEAREKWYKNADDIAIFMSSVNPYWSKSKWQDMLYEHLRLVEEEAVLRINGQYNKNVNIYDDLENQALDMADYMTFGVQKQFNL